MDHRNLYKSSARRNKAEADRTAVQQRRQLLRQSLHNEQRLRNNVSSATPAAPLPNPPKDALVAPPPTNLAPSQLMRMRQEEYKVRFLEWQRTKKEQQTKNSVNKKRPFASAVAANLGDNMCKPLPLGKKETTAAIGAAESKIKLKSIVPPKILPSVVRPLATVRSLPSSRLPASTRPPATTRPLAPNRPAITRPPPKKAITNPIASKPTLLTKQSSIPKPRTATALPPKRIHENNANKAKQDAIANKKQLLADKMVQKMKMKSAHKATAPLLAKKAVIAKPVPRRIIPAETPVKFLGVPAQADMSEARPKKSMEWLHPPQTSSEEQSFDCDGTLITSTAHKSFKSSRKLVETDPMGISHVSFSPIELDERDARDANDVGPTDDVEVVDAIQDAVHVAADVEAPAVDADVPVVDADVPVDLNVTPLKSSLLEAMDCVSPELEDPKPRRSSVRKSWSRRVTIDSQVPDEEAKLRHKASAVEFFYRELDDETMRLGELTEAWVQYKEQKQSELENKHIDMIDVSIGQTRLLVGSKFDQFRKLIVECESGPSSSDVKPVLPDDLEGFWRMVYLQVDKCKASFARLDEMRSNNWSEEQEVVPIVSKKPKKSSKSKKASVKAKPSKDFLEHLKKVRQEQRLKLAETAKENQSPSGTHRLLKTPVASRKSLLTDVLNKEARRSLVAGPSATSSPVPTPSNGYRRSVKFLQFDAQSPQKAGPSSSSPVMSSPVRKSNSATRRSVKFLVTDEPTPKKSSKKSILKTPGQPNYKRKGVVFAETLSPHRNDGVDLKPNRSSLRFAVTPMASQLMVEETPLLVSTSPFNVSSIEDESLPAAMDCSSRRRSFYLTPTSGKNHMNSAQRRILLETTLNAPSPRK